MADEEADPETEEETVAADIADEPVVLAPVGTEVVKDTDSEATDSVAVLANASLH